MVHGVNDANVVGSVFTVFIELVENKQPDKIEEYVKSVYPGEYVCVLGADQLRVDWVYPGTQFLITDYDGSESIQYKDGDYWSVA